MPFAVPMVRVEPKDHSSDCYYSLTNIAEITPKSKRTVKCPDLPSAMRPVPHSEWLPVPKLPKSDFSDDNSDSYEDHGQQEGENVDCDPPLEASRSSCEPHVLAQGDLNKHDRDLNLSKRQAGLLASRINGWNFLHQYTDIYFFRNHQNIFKEFFSEEMIRYCVMMFALL